MGEAKNGEILPCRKEIVASFRVVVEQVNEVWEHDGPRLSESKATTAEDNGRHGDFAPIDIWSCTGQGLIIA